MQGGRGNGDPFFDPFATFGGFGSQRSLIAPFFGGRDPFDDPFFTRPFGGMFESNLFGPMGNPFMGGPQPMFLQPQFPQPQPQLQPSRNRGPVIEELNSDDEEGGAKKEKKEKSRKHGRSGKEPYVEDPDDEAEGRKSKQIQYSNEVNSVNGHTRSHPQARSFSFQSSTVTYGGSNGAYYTSSATRRSGSDGLTFEERKEADSRTGQASHLLARGIHDKGHSVSRKLKSDGTVDMMQTLHNLNEDELSGFEEAWKGNAKKHLPGWTEGINMGHGSNAQTGPQGSGGWALPSNESSHYLENVKSNDREKGVSNKTTSRQNSGRMRSTADNNGNTRTGGGGGSTSKKMMDNVVGKH